MLLNLIGLMLLPDQVVVRSHGSPVTTFPCNRGLIVTDVGPTYTAKVAFHRNFANINFRDVRQPGVTLFVYVDDVIAMTLEVNGSVALTVPLDARPHHKIVAGSSISGEATDVWAACSDPGDALQ